MTTTTDAPAIPHSDIDPFCDDFLDDPYPAHRLLRDRASVIWLEQYGVYAMARHTEVAAALNDPDTFCSSAGVGLTDFRKNAPWRLPSLLLETDPPDHTRARHVITRILTPMVVRRLRDNFLEQARSLVTTLVARRRVDAVADLAQAFPLTVFPDLVGLPAEGRENLLPYGAMVFNGFGPRNVHFDRAMAKADQVTPWILAHCRREALSPNGLGARILDAAAEAGFCADDGARIVRSFLSAGVDTTVHGIGNAVLCMARHPEQWQRLRSDPTLARAAFEEVIRFESPVQTFFRTTTRHVDIGGTRVPAGEKVLLFLGAANRDERQWTEPDRFDITRKSGGHMGFGSGIHACVGQMLARLEGEVVLTALAEQVGVITADGPPVRQLNNTLRGLHSLPVTLTAAPDQ